MNKIFSNKQVCFLALRGNKKKIALFLSIFLSGFLTGKVLPILENIVKESPKNNFDIGQETINKEQVGASSCVVEQEQNNDTLFIGCNGFF